jgi:hypothetical protein
MAVRKSMCRHHWDGLGGQTSNVGSITDTGTDGLGTVVDQISTAMYPRWTGIGRVVAMVREGEPARYDVTTGPPLRWL